MAEVATRFRKAKQECEAIWRSHFEARLLELMALAEAAYKTPFIKPELEFSQRGTIAGSARLQTQLIRLNPVLLVAQPQTFLDQILPHELAHLLVHQRYGKVAPHGVQWRQMMGDVFKLTPLRTHQLDVSQVQGPLYEYACACQTHRLTIRRHNKILKGTSYRCRRCGQPLEAVA